MLECTTENVDIASIFKKLVQAILQPVLVRDHTSFYVRYLCVCPPLVFAGWIFHRDYVSNYWDASLYTELSERKSLMICKYRLPRYELSDLTHLLVRKQN